MRTAVSSHARRYRPMLEHLESRTLLTGDPVGIPVLVVPGLLSSLPSGSTALATFFAGPGASPTSLGTNGNYNSLLNDLSSLPGYQLGQNVLYAAYDSRLPVAPTDGNADGRLNFSGLNPEDNTYQYGVEYMRYWIEQARTQYISAHGNDAGFQVNIVGHSLGGVVARAFIQSDYYQSHYAGVVRNLVLLGTPNQGTIDAYLTANQTLGQFLSSGTALIPQLTDLSLFVSSVPLLAGQSITTFVPSVNNLLPTFTYLSGATPAENPLLSDLNANITPLTSGVSNVVAMAGVGLPTPATVSVINNSLAFTNGDGDGLVLTSSALLPGVASQTFTGVSHNQLPSNGDVQAAIRSALALPVAGGPQPSTNSAFVAQLYRDLLGREPDAGGLTYHTDRLFSGTSRADVAASIVSSDEHLSIVLRGLYEKLLLRTPSDGEVAAWLRTIRAENLGTEDVVARMTGSPEYFTRRGGGSRSGFLTAIYSDLLSRSPDPGAQAYFLDQLNNGVSSSVIASTIATSEEFYADVVQGLFQQYLRRPADAGAQAFYVARLQTGATTEQVLKDILASNEYLNLSLANSSVAT